LRKNETIIIQEKIIIKARSLLDNLLTLLFKFFREDYPAQDKKCNRPAALIKIKKVSKRKGRKKTKVLLRAGRRKFRFLLLKFLL